MSNLYYPLLSLKKGNWFKLICGASFQDLPAIRSLTLAYALAGADCIDVAADQSVIIAAQEGLAVAQSLRGEAALRGYKQGGTPLLMVSLNDGEDPHFRKAEFDPTRCPLDCPRPCETICPAQAIAFEPEKQGVISQRCYGCGRCLPVCPQGLIFTRSYVSTPMAVAPLLEQMDIEAVEIHTQVGHQSNFQRLWEAIAPYANQLKLLAVSCQDAPDLIDYLQFIYELLSPLPCPLIWQTDGRPMSGDLGVGTTRATVKLAQKVLAARLPGYVQLAGGTNGHTVAKLRSLGLLRKDAQTSQSPHISGIAYGSYARSLLLPILAQQETAISTRTDAEALSASQSLKLENNPQLLWQAVNQAHSLIAPLKLLSRDAEASKVSLSTLNPNC